MVQLSRRQFVRSVVGASALAGITRGQAATFQFGGQLSGWVGRAPEPIAGKTNPTIQVTAGKQYVISWENVDGEPHNVAIADGKGNVMKETGVVSQKGAVQTLEFTAKPKMATYFSQLNKETMRGKIVVKQPTTTATTANNTTTATNNTTSETTTTPSVTTTATSATTQSTTTTDTTTDGDSLPGFGFLAALGGIVGIGYLLRRKD